MQIVFSSGKDKFYLWGLVGLSFLCPLLALPLAILGIYHRKVEMLYPVVLSLAVLLCMVPITDDAYNYYRVFMRYQEVPLGEIFHQKDFLFYLFSYLCYQIGYSYFVLRFFLVASSVCMLAWIFISVCKDYPCVLENKHYFMLSVILFVLTLDFVSITNAMRHSSATVLTAVAFYLACKQKLLKSIVFYALAICMHFGAWLYLPPFFVLWGLRRWNISLGNRIVLLLLAYIFGEILFLYVFSFLPSFLQISTYTTGYWANVSEYQNVYGRLYSFLHHHLILFFLIPLFLFKRKISFNLEKVTYGILLTYVAYWALPAVCGRLFAILKLFVVLTLIVQGSKQIGYMRYVRIWCLIGLMAFSQSLDMYRFREALFVLDNVKFWAVPVSYLFDDYYTTRTYLFQNRNI